MSLPSISEVPKSQPDQVAEVVEELLPERLVPAELRGCTAAISAAVPPGPALMAPGLPGVACTSRKLMRTAASTVTTASASRRAR